MNPFFSIVIPTFNRYEELKRSIGSVIAQSFVDWELIVVDDGSEDETETLLNQYAKKDPRIRYFYRKTERLKGVSTCRNIGIEKAKGEYVAYLDSDDEWLENKLKNDYAIIQTNVETVALYSDCIINTGKRQYRAPSRHIKIGESYEDLIFSGENFNATSSYVIKRAVLTSYKFDENLTRHEDADLFIRIGNSIGWTHLNQSPHVVMNWHDVSDRFTGFESIVIFYKRYKDKSSNANHLARYLRWAWVCAARFDPSYKNFFRGELKKIYKKVDLKYQTFILLPEFLFFGWKVVRKLRAL